MLRNNAKKLMSCARRLVRARGARRFAQAQDAAVAVEFALVAAPFLALMFAIIETALVFFAGQTLEAAASEAGRMVMTGQVQTAGYNTLENFKSNVVCPGADKALGNNSLFDCSKLQIDVRTYTSFNSITQNNQAPIKDGALDTSKMCFSPGGSGDIVVVRFYYEWPIYLSLLNDSLSNLANGKRLLVATSVFRNEPFGSTSGSTPCP